MNIYFSCSITGGRRDQLTYASMVDFMKQQGHRVLTAHLAGEDVIKEETVVEAGEVYRRDVEWVESCDVLVAEVSTPSHGVGYEIALALLRGKAVLCCYHADRTVSKIILGNTHPNLTLCAYQGLADLREELGVFLDRSDSRR
jgi:hypothetical protein